MSARDIERGQAFLDECITEGETVNLLRGDAVKIEPIHWLWQGYLAAGKFTLLGGMAGTGKTTIALNMAARISQGRTWPDGLRAPVGNVVIWSGEDDPADTLAPRLTQAGADMRKVFFVDGVSGQERKRPFDPAQDIDALKLAILRAGNVKLLIVDPIASAVTGDSHKNTEVRRALQPLVDLAAETKCSLLGISHFAKNTAGRSPLERIVGSLAFGAMARIVLVAAKDEKSDERILCRAKANICADEGGFKYELDQTEIPDVPGVVASVVRWGEPLEGSARDILATVEESDRGKGSALDDAIDFLEDTLSDGAVPQKEIEAAAKSEGLSWKTVRRAKDSIGVISYRHGGIGGSGSWYWSLPASEDLPKMPIEPLRCPQKNMGTLDNFGHLSDDNGETEVIV
jgi:RecA-family ATPase